MNLKVKTGSLNQNDAINLMKKFEPVVYLHKSEQYFPSSIEKLGIDWSKAKFGTTDTYVTYTYKGPASFDSSAPVYTSIYENGDNTARISYIFFFAYNGCGPAGHVKAKLTGISVNTHYSMCPADVHWGDVEHIEVTVSRSNSNSPYNTVKKIKYAFHKWSKTYTSDGSEDGKLSDHVKFTDSTHPIVYLAKGSHAAYPTAGENEYLTIWSKKDKPWYDTYGILVDYCAPNTTDAFKWSGTSKLLKLNGSAVSGISNDEYNMGFKYYGEVGGKIENKTASDLENIISTVRKVAKALKISKVVNALDDASENLDKYYEATGCASIGSTTRTYW